MIVAELSHNHQGDLSLLKEMIAAAAQAGVQAVKIQTHYAKDLSTGWLKERKEHVEAYELSEQAHHLFSMWCGEYGVQPVTSVYTDRYCEMLKGNGITTLKLGSAECQDQRLMQSLIQKDFVVWASSGGHDIGSLKFPDQIGVIMHCRSIYPHPPNQAGMLRMKALQERFPQRVGYSSHVDPTHPEWMQPIRIAALMGAAWIEVHFTLKPRRETKDGAVSLDFNQLKEVCDFCRVDESKTERDLIAHYKTRWK